MAENSYAWNKKSTANAISRALETLSARYPALAPQVKGTTETIF